MTLADEIKRLRDEGYDKFKILKRLIDALEVARVALEKCKEVCISERNGLYPSSYFTTDNQKRGDGSMVMRYPAQEALAEMAKLLGVGE